MISVSEKQKNLLAGIGLILFSFIIDYVAYWFTIPTDMGEDFGLGIIFAIPLASIALLAICIGCAVLLLISQISKVS